MIAFINQLHFSRRGEQKSRCSHLPYPPDAPTSKNTSPAEATGQSYRGFLSQSPMAINVSYHFSQPLLSCILGPACPQLPRCSEGFVVGVSIASGVLR